MNPELDRQRAEKRRHLLARMAGNIAAGMAAAPDEWIPKPVSNAIHLRTPAQRMASEAVEVARAILEELER